MTLRRRSLLQGATAAGAGALATAATPVRRGRGAETRRRSRSGGGRVLTGFDTLVRDRYGLVAGQRVGLISNPTGVVTDLRHEVDVMAADDRVNLVAAFGPEHGFRGSAQAGGSEGDYSTPAPASRSTTPTQDTGPDRRLLHRRRALDTVMFDIQDVGARFYTYIWTMYDCMVAASLAGVRFVVLDRPNPISATAAYGPVLHPEHATFVGRKAISQQHGMTVGELAGLFNAEFLPEDPNADGPVELAVSRMSRWRRDMYSEETGQPWVMPSPNMPRVETAIVYPGTCLFEATNLSEGRGTTRPFELIGAPYVDYHWAEALSDLDLDGRRLPRGLLHAVVLQAHRRRLRRRAAARHRPRRLRRDPHRDRDDRHGPRPVRRVRVAGERAAVLDRPALRQRAGPAGDRRRRRVRRGGERSGATSWRSSTGSALVTFSTQDDGREATGRHRAGVRGRDSRGDRDAGMVSGRPGPTGEWTRRASGSGSLPHSFDTTGQDLHFQHHRLRPGSPAQARLLAAPLAQMSVDLRSFLGPSPDHPMYAGGVVLASRHGVVPVHDAAGKALRYADTRDRAPGRPAGADPPRHDLRPGIRDQDLHHDRRDAAGRGRPGRPRRAGGDVPPRLRPERQGRRHDPAPAHPHRRACRPGCRSTAPTRRSRNASPPCWPSSPTRSPARPTSTPTSA